MSCEVMSRAARMKNPPDAGWLQDFCSPSFSSRAAEPGSDTGWQLRNSIDAMTWRMSESHVMALRPVLV